MKECDEGKLVWVLQKDIMSLQLWEGDRIFLQKLIDGDTAQFHIHLYYNQNDELLRSMEE